MVSRANTGEHQQLWRVDRTSTEQYLAPGSCCSHLIPLVYFLIYNTTRSAIPYFDAHSLSFCTYRKVGTAPSRLNISADRTPAHAILLRDLVDTRTCLRLSIKVRVLRNAQLYAGIDESARQRIGIFQICYIERPINAMIFRSPQFLMLRLFKIGQHIRIAPTRIASFFPGIIIVAVAANIDHGIDRTASS